MRIHLGHVSQVPLGQGKCFVIGHHEVAVFRGRDGALFALQNQCPHRGGPLSDGITGDGKIVCPLHGHKFDLNTGEGHDGDGCLQTYKVVQEGSNIILSFDFSMMASAQKVGV